jgi:1,5-anhydro-D-fructose reductase (1,5-anhydro-D-mannitol-forming)
VVHDADTVRFHLGEDPAEVVAIQTSAGMGAGVEDSVMSVWQMPSGATVMTHESFTHRFAGTGIEFHGTKGSIRAIRGHDAAAHRSGHADDRGRGGRGHVLRPQPLCPLGRYVHRCRRGQGRPERHGIDGIKSLAVASAVSEAATTGRRVAVDYGGV